MRRYRLVLSREIQLGDNVRTLITGFPGFGAVGYITTKYMVEKLRMKRIGYIATPLLPDFTSLEDYGLSLPHEVFIDEHGRLVVLLNRMNPQKSYINSYVTAVLKLIKELNIGEVLLIGGLDVRFKEGDEEYRWLKNSYSHRYLDAPQFLRGPLIVGPLASLLIALELKRVPALAIFPYTEPEVVNHKAAAIALKVIQQLIGIEIDLSELLRYAEYIERMEETIKQMSTQEGHKESMMYM